MRLLQFYWLVGLVLWSGCIAGPTPHPSTSESGTQFTEDSGAGGNVPPGAGTAEDCEAQGGVWSDEACQMGMEPSADASSVIDSTEESDTSVSDAESEDDGTGERSSDAGPTEG